MKFIAAHPNNFMIGRNGTAIDRIVLHWIVGTLESADVTFKNPNRIASAHYGIGDDEIHQYVKEEDTAFANGNWTMNLRAISIEHEGGPDLPISNLTYETSAKLVAGIAKEYSIPLDRDHVKKHKEVSDNPTACPGTLDIDRIIVKAKEISAVITQPIPQDPNTQSMKQIIIDCYRALCGEEPSEDEIKYRLNQKINTYDLIRDICNGDERFEITWGIEDLLTANDQQAFLLEDLRKQLKECQEKPQNNPNLPPQTFSSPIAKLLYQIALSIG